MILGLIYGLTVLYALLMLLYNRGWKVQGDHIVEESYIPKTQISVIVPARNEEQNIEHCISSILAQNYPVDLFEVIVVDDYSTDSTFDIVSSIKTDKQLSCIKLSEHLTKEHVTSFKKEALQTGISLSKGDLIVTTDADTITNKNWLRNIASCYEQEKPTMIVGPVSFTNNNSLVQLFQSLDFMSLQGVTVASLQTKWGNMCNGANLAFSKVAFNKVGGYDGIKHIASGDDYLLMTKINKNYPNSIVYLKAEDAIVKTSPQPNWNAFLQQRIRWASKSGKYNDNKLTVVLLLVYLFNLSLLGLAVATIINQVFIPHLLIVLVIKTIVETIFLYPVSKFYKKTREIFFFPLFQPLHIIYIVLAGLLGFVGKYQWKGREVS